MVGDFVKVERPVGPCWQHNSKPCWIVYYPAAYPPRYEAYTVKPYVSEITKTRLPWTLENMRLSRGGGFKTFDDAVKAIEALQ